MVTVAQCKPQPRRVCPSPVHLPVCPSLRQPAEPLRLGSWKVRVPRISSHHPSPIRELKASFPICVVGEASKLSVGASKCQLQPTASQDRVVQCRYRQPASSLSDSQCPHPSRRQETGQACTHRLLFPRGELHLPPSSKNKFNCEFGTGPGEGL